MVYYRGILLRLQTVVGGANAVTSKVMKVNATVSDAFASKNFGADQSNTWVTFGLYIPNAALTFWNGDGSGDFVTILDPVQITAGFDEYPDVGPTPGWFLYAGPSTNVESTGPPAPTADTWVTVEFHIVRGGMNDGLTELYVDTTLVANITDSTYVVRSMRMGQHVTPTNGSGDIIYIKDVMVGTTRGGSDIFADDFSSGDLSLWDSTFGNVSVVVNPFP